jgi:hypothetical protein
MIGMLLAVAIGAIVLITGSWLMVRRMEKPKKVGKGD